MCYFDYMRKYSFSHTAYSTQQLTGQIINTDSAEVIGTYEMYVKDDTFIAAINIFPDYQKSGIGFDTFKYCFDILNETNDLKIFLASWNLDNEYSHLPNGSSVNLTKYFEAIDNGADNETALWQTPTGKWLKEIGFNKVNLTKSSREAVKATFFK